MDEERQETADWRIVWQMFFPCVISDLIGGCVEVLGHLEGNAGRTVSSFLTFAVIYPFYWRRMQKKKENRRIGYSKINSRFYYKKEKVKRMIKNIDTLYSHGR